MSFLSNLFGGKSLEQELIEAASVWNRKRVIELLDAGANVNAQNKKGQSILCHALNVSDAEMTKVLIERGADVELTANDGMTPLMIAVFRQFTEGVRLLCFAGADPARTSGEGDSDHSPMDVAAALENEEIAGILAAAYHNRQSPFLQKLEQADPIHAAVKEAALGDLPELFSLFNKRAELAGYIFSVKVPIQDEHGVEHLWLIIYEINEQSIFGTVANDPTTIKSFKFGDAVQTPHDSVEDVMVTNEKMDIVLGGHFMRLTQKRMR